MLNKRDNIDQIETARRFGEGLLIGAVLGAVAGIFLAPRSGRENREEAAKRLEELKNKMIDRTLQEDVRAIFGDITDEGKKLYRQAQRDFKIRVRKMGDRQNELGEREYKKIADEVVKDLQTEDEGASTHLSALKDRLVQKYISK